LASHVQAIAGLSNLALPHPTLQTIHTALFSAFCALEIGTVANLAGWDPNSAAGRRCILNALAMCINGNAMAVGYGLQIAGNIAIPDTCFGFGTGSGSAAANSSSAASSPWQSVDGTGNTIGLVEFDNFHPSDVSDYLNLILRPATDITKLSVVD